MILIVIGVFVLSGSPFAVNVMDTQRVVVFGKGLGSAPVNSPATFTVLTQNAGVGELRCLIKGGVENSFSFFVRLLVMVSSSTDISSVRILFFFS